MAERLKKVFGRVELRILLALALGVLTATLIYSVAQEKDDPPFDEEEYKEILSYQLNDIYDLEQWFAAQQYEYLPLLPPFSDFILENQTGLQNLLPVDAEKFPEEFVKGLSGIYEYSVPVYPIKIVEDAQTRALKFYNYDGENFYTLPAAAEYDPFADLKDRMPNLYAGKANEAGRNYWQSIFDPARVRISVSLIASDDVEHWLYAKAKVQAAEEEEEGGGEMMMVMQENATTNIYFAEIKKVTNGVSMTIKYPSGFTNGLDVFMISELVPEIWSFATKSLPTTGTNLTWVDTNSWVQSGYPVRMYSAADATTDADGDGYADGREIMVYQTDPNAATSRPVSVSGTVSYSGPETGTIYVIFSALSNGWSLAKSTALNSPGAYTNNEIGNYQSYWFNAFRDVNGNFACDGWEPWGTYSVNSMLVTGDTSGINITLADVPSVWGQISYTRTATGDVHVIAVTSSNSWDTTYEAVIPYIQSVGESGELYYVAFPANYSIIGLPASNYWIRAFMDADTNGFVSAFDPAGWATTNSIAVSNRVTGQNITLNADTDSDGMPDWWEIKHGLNPQNASDASSDPDGDGLTNLAEYQNGTTPNVADSDGDGISDGEEINSLGTNPLNSNDAASVLTDARQRIVIYWNMIYTTPLTFTNAPGSAADLQDLDNALQSLSGKFQKMQ